MLQAHETAAVRAAEQAVLATVADGTLMRRAAFALAAVVARELAERTGGVAGRRVVLLVGSGGNGGDALWAGAFLCRRGVAVTAVLLVPDRAHPVGLAALRRAGGRTGGVGHSDGDSAGDGCLAGADLVVDGVVGLSARGPLRSASAEVVRVVLASGLPVVAADLPSGVDPDTGQVHEPAVRAVATVAFGALTPVHLLAAGHCGRTDLVELGFELGRSRLGALTAADIGAGWPVPGPADDKYTQGVVGVLAGSATYPGAAVLCAGAAVASTSGMVRYAGTAKDAVLARWPEVVATAELADAGRVQAWVVGPGLGTDDAALSALRTILSQDVPTLLDADALTVLARDPGLLRGRSAPALLTPHAGEFARLTGAAPGADRVAGVRAAAERFAATVLLKGRTTIVADPDGDVLVHPGASSWVSTAGAGDLLSGVVGALLAAGFAPLTATASGALVHARAGELAALRDGYGAPVSASTVLEHLRPAIRGVRAVAR